MRLLVLAIFAFSMNASAFDISPGRSVIQTTEHEEIVAILQSKIVYRDYIGASYNQRIVYKINDSCLPKGFLDEDFLDKVEFKNLEIGCTTEGGHGNECVGPFLSVRYAKNGTLAEFYNSCDIEVFQRSVRVSH